MGVFEIRSCNCCERDFDQKSLIAKTGADGLVRVSICPDCTGEERCTHGVKRSRFSGGVYPDYAEIMEGAP